MPALRLDGDQVGLRPCAAMLLAGCVVDHLPRPSDRAAPRFAELRLKGPRPHISTLRKLGAQRPDATVLALRAPGDCVAADAGSLAPSPALDKSLVWLDHAVQALGASVIVVRTPIDVTPGARSRELLHAYAAKLPREKGRVWVWAPRGPWEPEAAHALANEVGLVCAFDPLHTPRPAGPVAYAQLHGLGVETRLSNVAIERVLDAIAPEQGTVYVAADGPHAARHAALIQQLADARGDATPR